MTDANSDSGRRFDRFECQLRMYLKEGRDFVPQLTSNISKHGVFVLVDRVRAARQLLQVILEFPKSTGEMMKVSTLGTVMWSREIKDPRAAKPAGLGLKFFSMSEDDRLAWESFVERVRREGAPVVPETPAPTTPAVVAGEKCDVPRKLMRFVVQIRNVDRLRDFYTRDISLGGMFLKTDVEKQPGEVIQVLLLHPWTGGEFPLTGVVKRVERDPRGKVYGLGIEFQPSEKQDRFRECLLTYIESGFKLRRPEDDVNIESSIKRKVAELEKKIAIDPALTADSHYEVGLLYLFLSQIGEAIEHLQTAAKLGYPLPPEVKEKLARLTEEPEIEIPEGD